MRKINTLSGANRGDIVAAKDSSGVVRQYVAIRPTMTTPPGADWTLAVVDGAGSPFWEAGPKGKDGRDGVSPPPAKDGKDGRDGVDAESFNPVGEYRATKQYEPLDVVTHEGSSYVCTNPNKNREPSDGSRYWQLLAAQGKRGKPGEQGGAGQRGRSSIVLQNEILQRLEEIEAGGSGGSELLPLIFDSNAVKGLALYASSDGHADLAIATAHPGAIGLCNSDTVASGAAGLVNPDGVIELEDWSSVTGSPLLNPGTVYYLSATTPGFITSTAPTAPGQYVVVIGRAISSTALAIEIDSPVLL